MASTRKSTAKDKMAPAEIFSAFPAAFMANLPTAPMNSSAAWWQAYMTGAAEMNKEFMSFVATRLQHDVELGQSLSKCTDWSDAASVHSDWISKLSEEYRSEAERLMRIASTAAQESWAAATDDAGSDDAAADKPG